MSDLIAEQMQAIYERWGALIASTCDNGNGIKPSLLAAIVGNESGGDPNAKRFEPTVLLELWEVAVGRKPSFDDLGAIDIWQAIAVDIAPLPAGAAPDAKRTPIDLLRNLDALATSWGLTQIMGYNWLAGVDKLTDPAFNLARATAMLAAWAKEWKLGEDPTVAHTVDQDLLSCWNTGKPMDWNAPTKYVQNGIARMTAYGAILDSVSK